MQQPQRAPGTHLAAPFNADGWARTVVEALQADMARHGADMALVFRHLYPHVPESHALCAEALRMCGETVAALDAWDKALRWAPRHSDWFGKAFDLAFACHAPLGKSPGREAKSVDEYIADWLVLLERCFLAPPPANLLETLEERRLIAPGFGSVGIHQGALSGWMWLPLPEAPVLSVSGGVHGVTLRTSGSIARKERALHFFSAVLPPVDSFFFVSVTGSGEYATTHAKGSPVPCDPPGRFNSRSHVRPGAAKTGQAASARVAVIVPVYGDRKATLACLGSLFASRGACGTPFDIVVAWDHGPDQRLFADLERLAERGKILLHITPVNLGFLASVNQALRLYPERDVVLLNADTLVCGDWLDRLKEAASTPKAATVTPFGSNAELLSLPSFIERAAIHSLRETRRLDAACKKACACDAPIPIPVGVGFCMYITAAALDALGGLDGYLLFGGYGEEVDFCLRAREHGFHNLAACNVFVTHRGERSYGSAKKALVAQNNAALFARYPKYYAEYAKFLEADPLEAQRGRIAHALSRPLPGPAHVYSVLDSFPLGKLRPRQSGDEADRAELFVAARGSGFKVNLRVSQGFPLPDREFLLPRDLGALRDALAPLEPRFLSLHSQGAAVEAVASLLPYPRRAAPADPLAPQPWSRAWHSASGAFLVSTPRGVAAWQHLRREALARPNTIFWVIELDAALGKAPLPANVRSAPDMDDLRAFGVDTLLIIGKDERRADWVRWAGERDLRAYAPEEGAMPLAGAAELATCA